MMAKISSLDDAFTLVFACTCAAIGATVQDSLEMGILMAGAILTLGILSMRIGPVRRSVNRAALVAERWAGKYE